MHPSLKFQGGVSIIVGSSTSSMPDSASVNGVISMLGHGVISKVGQGVES